VAAELLARHQAVFVTAEEQLAGRGRNGKLWVGDSYQNIYLSLAVDESKIELLKNKVIYQIIGCLAVKQTLLNFISDRNIRLKYPNDVYVENDENLYKKIAGVLSEHSYSGRKCTESILGIGINVLQTKFDDTISNKATSILLLGYCLDKDEILEDLKNNINDYINKSEDEVFTEWTTELAIVGKEVIVVNKSQKYRVDKIDENGTLYASNSNEEIKINNGDSIIYDLG